MQVDAIDDGSTSLIHFEIEILVSQMKPLIACNEVNVFNWAMPIFLLKSDQPLVVG